MIFTSVKAPHSGHGICQIPREARSLAHCENGLIMGLLFKRKILFMRNGLLDIGILWLRKLILLKQLAEKLLMDQLALWLLLLKMTQHIRLAFTIKSIQNFVISMLNIIKLKQKIWLQQPLQMLLELLIMQQHLVIAFVMYVMLQDLNLYKNVLAIALLEL